MHLIIIILLVVDLFLWFLTLLPQTQPNWGPYGGWLALIAVCLLTVLVASGGSYGLSLR